MTITIGKSYIIKYVDPNYPCSCICHTNRGVLHCAPCCYDRSYEGEAQCIDKTDNEWYTFECKQLRCMFRLHRDSVKEIVSEDCNQSI